MKTKVILDNLNIDPKYKFLSDEKLAYIINNQYNITSKIYIYHMTKYITNDKSGFNKKTSYLPHFKTKSMIKKENPIFTSRKHWKRAFNRVSDKYPNVFIIKPEFESTFTIDYREHLASKVLGEPTNN